MLLGTLEGRYHASCRWLALAGGVEGPSGWWMVVVGRWFYPAEKHTKALESLDELAAVNEGMRKASRDFPVKRYPPSYIYTSRTLYLGN